MKNGHATKRLVRYAELRSKGVSINAALRASGLRTHNSRWAENHPIVLETRKALINSSVEDHLNVQSQS